VVNNLCRLRGEVPVPFQVGESEVMLQPRVYVVSDWSCMRHCESLTNSGFCACDREAALRFSPSPPYCTRAVQENDLTCECDDCVKVMMSVNLTACKQYTCKERYMKSHNRYSGDGRVHPCPDCKFGHSINPELELATAQTHEVSLKAKATDPAGKKVLADWRLGHAKVHGNVQPLSYGEPTFDHDMEDQLPDVLHLDSLNAPKVPWKHAYLNNISDHARERTSDLLVAFRHPLDTRRRDIGRVQGDKWYRGEKWLTLLRGERGSPGGPVLFANLALIMADDLTVNNLPPHSAAAKQIAKQKATLALVPALAPNPKPTGRHAATASFSGFGAAPRKPSPLSTTPAPTQTQPTTARPTFTHDPTAAERACDPRDLEIIRASYPLHCQTIINFCLVMDAYVAWHYQLVAPGLTFMCPMEIRIPRALKLCQLGCVFHEICERVSIRAHKSFVPHAMTARVPQAVLAVGDLGAVSLSSLELLNAEVKRTAEGNAPRRLESVAATEATIAPRGGKLGPARRAARAVQTATMATATCAFMTARQYIRRSGEGIARRKVERLFGATGTGRTSLARANERLCRVGGDAAYAPENDTTIAALARILRGELARTPIPAEDPP
jgi:hypothetical protein